MGRLHMTHITEAIYTHGMLQPAGNLPLREQQRVRLIIQPLDGGNGADRQAALDRLRAGIKQMSFRSGGTYPRRDELHDRI
jgi:predicted DNA-binding antitoxin AbrB/MazE fold protein